MYRQITELLDSLQQELETLGLWQSIAPAAEKMMSTEPFSIDSLSFTEWLQWIYIARLRAIIEAQGRLPKGAQVHPYAQESFKTEASNGKLLLACIKQLDDALA